MFVDNFTIYLKLSCKVYFSNSKFIYHFHTLKVHGIFMTLLDTLHLDLFTNFKIVIPEILMVTSEEQTRTAKLLLQPGVVGEKLMCNRI